MKESTSDADHSPVQVSEASTGKDATPPPRKWSRRRLALVVSTLVAIIGLIASIMGIFGTNLPNLLGRAATPTPTPLATQAPSVLVNCLPDSVPVPKVIEHVDTTGLMAQSSAADAMFISQVESVYAKDGNRYAGVVELYAGAGSTTSDQAISQAIAVDNAISSVLSQKVAMFKYARFQDFADFSAPSGTVRLEVFFFQVSCQLGSP